MATLSRPSSPDARSGGVLAKRWVLRAVGLVLLFVAPVVHWVLRFDAPSDLPAVVGWSPAVIALIGAGMLYRGKQRAAAVRSRAMELELQRQSAAAAKSPVIPVELDKQSTAATKSPVEPSGAAPVVYLRPFATDASGIGQIFSSLLTMNMFRPVTSEEEQLAHAVAPVGPLVGIGEPGDDLPQPGAIRLYPAQWQERVVDLLQRARLVILRPGSSPGVLWEVEQTFKTVAPEKVVLLLFRTKWRDYDELRTRVAETCHIELPAFEVRRRLRVHALVEFGPDWNPTVRLLKAPFWRIGWLEPMRSVFNHALRPVVQRLGAPWRPSPISASKVVIALILGLITLWIGTAVLDAGIRRHDELSMGTSTDLAPSAGASPEAPVNTASDVGAEQPQSSAQGAKLEVAGLQLAMTGTMQPTELAFSAEVRQICDSIASYGGRDGAREVLVTRLDFKSGFVLDAKKMTQHGLESMERNARVRNLSSSMTDSSVSDHPAVRVVSSFQLDGEWYLLQELSLVVGQTFWMVQVFAPQGYEDSASRLLDLVELADGAR